MKLNKEQQIAATYPILKSVLISAPAGSGKTAVIVERVIHLLKHGVDAENIWLCSFTKRAANEMDERIKSRLGRHGAKVRSLTSHSLALLIMRAMPKTFGLKNSNVIDPDDQKSVMDLAIGEVANEDLPKPRDLVAVQSFVRNSGLNLKTYLKKNLGVTGKLASDMAKAIAIYGRIKKEKRYLDFDDVLETFVEKLKTNDRVALYVSKKIRYFCMDEYQDSNCFQIDIATTLANQGTVVFGVGDVRQSIYGFRGSMPQGMLDFVHTIPNSKALDLQINYRSTQEILDVCNWLLKQSEVDYGIDMVAHRGSGIKPVVMNYQSEEQEAVGVVMDIRIKCKNENWNDYMIMVRSAFAAKMVEALLIQTETPYIFIGGQKLQDTAHVKDLLSAVRAARSTADSLGWMRYLTLFPGLGSVTATKVIRAITGKKPSQTPDIVDKVLGRKDVSNPLRSVTKNLKNPHAAISGLAKSLNKLMLGRYKGGWEFRKKDFDLLVKTSGDYSTLRKFVDAYSLDPISKTETEEKKVVTLITAHSAKGLECKVCYVLRAQPGSYPHTRSIGELDQEEEERRILYVAMSRAQNELILTRVDDKYDETGPDFLWGIPDSILELEGPEEELIDDDEDQTVDVY